MYSTTKAVCQGSKKREVKQLKQTRPAASCEIGRETKIKSCIPGKIKKEEK